MNHEVERAAVAESNCRKVTRVARYQPADAEVKNAETLSRRQVVLVNDT